MVVRLSEASKQGSKTASSLTVPSEAFALGPSVPVSIHPSIHRKESRTLFRPVFPFVEPTSSTPLCRYVRNSRFALFPLRFSPCCAFERTSSCVNGRRSRLRARGTIGSISTHTRFWKKEN